MANFHISDIYQQIININRHFKELTRSSNILHIIPSYDMESGGLWWSKKCWNDQSILNPFHVCYSANDISFLHHSDLQTWFEFCIKVNAEEYPKEILTYYAKRISQISPIDLYVYKPIYKITNNAFSALDREGLYISMAFIFQTPVVLPLFNFNSDTSLIDSNLYNVLKKYIESINSKIDTIQQNKIQRFQQTRNKYLQSSNGISNYLSFLLEESFYSFIFNKIIKMEYHSDTSTLIIDYVLPNRQDTPNEVVNKSLGWNRVAVSKEKKIYDSLLYTITLRTLAEICHYDEKRYIEHICFNGKIKDRSPVTGQMKEKYILSINVSREQIESLNLEFINPKECFKHLKGVCASKLYEPTEIRPIITPSFNDTRFVKAKNIETNQYTNLAEMDWEEFEHLVRQVFEWEFSDKGGEVNVTQSSRDGGVDAIVFDPDPIRGGKIIIQAKRYTNTVPVSAVRDLYGSIINEGANKGILITTSDYGPDSYKFAQGKPITLLNGGHLLYLIEKHGRHARIDIQEAKNKIKGSI